MKKVVVIGGTGTLGKALIKELLEEEYEITCVSRCELKQKQLNDELKSDRVTFLLGDVRDSHAMKAHLRGAFSVFLVAALKHVDILEMNPYEAIKTNIIGTQNVIDAVTQNHVPYFSFCSTDKAVEPLNAYGMSKGLAEKLVRRSFLNANIFRWGNVLGSRGSVIHEFAKTIKEGGYVNITHPDMTRFWLLIENAARFMIAHHNKPSSKILIPPMKASKVTELAEAVSEVVNPGGHLTIRNIGIRPGEKLHEKITDGMESNTYAQYTKEELIELVKRVL